MVDYFSAQNCPTSYAGAMLEYDEVPHDFLDVNWR